MITWVSGLEPEGIGLKRRLDVLETTSPSGMLTFHGFAAQAAFTRQLIQERTQAGRRAASVRDRVGGRPKVLAAGKRQRAVRLSQEKQLTVKDSCAMMGISKLTLDAYVRQSQVSAPGAHHAAR